MLCREPLVSRLAGWASCKWLFLLSKGFFFSFHIWQLCLCCSNKTPFLFVWISYIFLSFSLNASALFSFVSCSPISETSNLSVAETTALSKIRTFGPTLHLGLINCRSLEVKQQCPHFKLKENSVWHRQRHRSVSESVPLFPRQKSVWVTRALAGLQILSPSQHYKCMCEEALNGC